MSGTSEDYCSMFAEAITCLDSKIKEQSEAQQKQVLEIEELKRKVSILEQHDNGKSIRQLIDIATKVSMINLMIRYMKQLKNFNQCMILHKHR